MSPGLLKFSRRKGSLSSSFNSSNYGNEDHEYLDDNKNSVSGSGSRSHTGSGNYNDETYGILSATELIRFHKDKARLKRKRIRNLMRRELRNCRSVALLLVSAMALWLLVLFLRAQRRLTALLKQEHDFRLVDCVVNQGQSAGHPVGNAVGNALGNTVGTIVDSKFRVTSQDENDPNVWKICGRTIAFNFRSLQEELNSLSFNSNFIINSNSNFNYNFYSNSNSNSNSNFDLNKTILLLDKNNAEHQFGDFGARLSSFFHAFDKAHDTNAIVVLEGHGWGHSILDSFWKLFYNDYDISHQDNNSTKDTDEQHKKEEENDKMVKFIVETMLQIPYSKDESDLMTQSSSSSSSSSMSALSSSSSVNIIKEAPENYFFYRSKNITSSQRQSHRESLLRRLFLLAKRGDSPQTDVCSAIQNDRYNNDEINENNDISNKVKYSVIHPIPSMQMRFIHKLNHTLGKDKFNTDAIDMKPSYVKSILNFHDMLTNTIFIISPDGNNYNNSNLDNDDNGDNGNFDEEDVTNKIIQYLQSDPIIAPQLKFIPDDIAWFGNSIMLAILADVYLGTPLDVLSVWIARMRLALGLNHTYVYTKKKNSLSNDSDHDDEWTSYADEYFLYDYLGPWTG